MTADTAYNAGVSELAQGQTSSAIADLIVARDLAPRDTEIAAALNGARAQAGSLIHAAEPWPVASTELGGTLVVVNLALACAIALRARRAVVAGLVGALMLTLGTWIVRLVTTPSYGIVAKADATTHVANDAASLTRFAVHEGDELPIESSSGDWLKVRGPDGTRAYIPRDAVAIAK